VYACGSGLGPRGPEAGKRGFDAISFWSRGSVADSVTPEGLEPLGMPSGGFGDSLSGMALAGGVAAAIARKEKTGEGSLVDGSLLATAMWGMQMWAVGAAVAGTERMPGLGRDNVRNPLVNTYRTRDERWIALCMMQPAVHWAPFCQAIGRDDLATDPRFVSDPERAAHLAEAVAALEETFATKVLAEWLPILSAQQGPWEVLRNVSELVEDPQARANGFVQDIDYGEGRVIPLIASPVQFDRTPPTLAPAPVFAGDSDEILLALGWDWPRILEAKESGAVL
jgi:crotonobetainyl-CoA:carnitine CoA-transferase CaiB-like acyl-CoA transferase